jgi:hypothetical protein
VRIFKVLDPAQVVHANGTFALSDAAFGLRRRSRSHVPPAPDREL